MPRQSGHGEAIDSADAKIISAAFSAIIMVGALVLLDVILGKTDHIPHVKEFQSCADAQSPAAGGMDFFRGRALRSGEDFGAPENGELIGSSREPARLAVLRIRG